MLLIFPKMRNHVEQIEGQHASRLTQMPQDGRVNLTPGAAQAQAHFVLGCRNVVLRPKLRSQK